MAAFGHAAFVHGGGHLGMHPAEDRPPYGRAGYVATGLDDIAAEAALTRAMLYRHFDSKADLYRAVLDRACVRLAEATGTDDFS